MAKKAFVVFISLLFSLLILHLWGFRAETCIRNFYRDKICNCDTLREKMIIGEDGIPQMNYYSTSGEYIGLQYNPLEICQKAQEYYQKSSIDSSYIKLFINCVDWLLNNAKIQESSAILEYNYPWKEHGVKPPWISAMTQAAALEVLVNANKITGERKYLDFTTMLTRVFFIPVDSNGVTYKFSENNWWYEEYSHPESKKPMVLNGMMFTLIKLHDYYLLAKDSSMLFLFNNGFNALADRIHLYNRNEGSYYDINGTTANSKYHQIHVNHLNNLLKIRKNENLEKYYEIWSKIKNKPYIIERLKAPNQAFVFLFCFLFFTFGLIASLVFTNKKSR